MVTYFNRKDLVNFGKYLLSDKRTASIINNTPTLNDEKEFDNLIRERLKTVHHADVENFLESIKKVE